MAQVNTFIDLGFVGGKHLYHTTVKGLALTGVVGTVDVPCDQIQAVVGGALNPGAFTSTTVTFAGNTITITANEGAVSDTDAVFSFFVLGF